MAEATPFHCGTCDGSGWVNGVQCPTCHPPRRSQTADHSFHGCDPLENGYDPAVAERAYRRRIGELMEENEQLRAENDRLKGWLRWFRECREAFNPLKKPDRARE